MDYLGSALREQVLVDLAVPLGQRNASARRLKLLTVRPARPGFPEGRAAVDAAISAIGRSDSADLRRWFYIVCPSARPEVWHGHAILDCARINPVLLSRIRHGRGAVAVSPGALDVVLLRLRGQFQFSSPGPIHDCLTTASLDAGWLMALASIPHVEYLAAQAPGIGLPARVKFWGESHGFSPSTFGAHRDAFVDGLLGAPAASHGRNPLYGHRPWWALGLGSSAVEAYLNGLSYSPARRKAFRLVREEAQALEKRARREAARIRN